MAEIAKQHSTAAWDLARSLQRYIPEEERIPPQGVAKEFGVSDGSELHLFISMSNLAARSESNLRSMTLSQKSIGM